MAKFQIEAEIEIPEPPREFRVLVPGREKAMIVGVGSLSAAQITDIVSEWGKRLRVLAGSGEWPENRDRRDVEDE